jgi:thioredoxin-related protein
MVKTLSLFLLGLLLTSQSKWETDFETAKKRALEEHKCILINFSGSDWCGPCIRLRKDIFELDAFQKMASLELVLLNADFPPEKKSITQRSSKSKIMSWQISIMRRESFPNSIAHS